MSETLSVGDRVERIGFDNTAYVPVGSVGVVEAIEQRSVEVRWDHQAKGPDEAIGKPIGTYNSVECLRKLTSPQFIRHETTNGFVKPLDLTPGEITWVPDSPFPEGDPIGKVIAERGKRYGSFDSHAKVTYDLKRVLMPAYDKMEDDQREALDMICHKLGRIVNGDPHYADSWTDIAGYAQLVADRLNKK